MYPADHMGTPSDCCRHSSRSGPSPELLLRSCGDLRLDDHVGRKPESSLRLWPALLCNRDKFKLTHYKKFGRVAFRQGPAVPLLARRGRRAKHPCFFGISAFFFPKTNIPGILLHRPLVNGKRVTAMQPENFRLADRAESESNRCRAFAPPRSLEPPASQPAPGEGLMTKTRETFPPCNPLKSREMGLESRDARHDFAFYLSLELNSCYQIISEKLNGV